MSVSVIVLPGEHDDSLEWPFDMELTVTLLNQASDDNHTSTTLMIEQTSDEVDVRDLRKAFPDIKLCVGKAQFINLKRITSPEYFHVYQHVRYNMDNTVYFRVTAEKKNDKPWLAGAI